MTGSRGESDRRVESAATPKATLNLSQIYVAGRHSSRELPHLASRSDKGCSVYDSDSDSNLTPALTNPAAFAPSLYSDSATLSTTVERQCVNCARPFAARIRDVARGRGLHCSRSCASATRARQQHARRPEVGPANRNFKGWASRHPRVYVDRFRAKYPEKARAHDAVKNALKRGDLIRPVACQQCGLVAPLHAHHDDYGHPLAVRFVCRACHRALDDARRLLEVSVALIPKRCYLIPQLLPMLQLSRRAFYSLLAQGKLPMLEELQPRIGGRRRYRADLVDRYLAGQWQTPKAFRRSA